MPSLDRDHEVVRNALIKEGWTIINDPLYLTLGPDRLFVDLGAERVIAAQQGTRKIAVEIKTFKGKSKIADLEAALGQFLLYRIALRRLEPGRELYLAAPQDVVANEFHDRELWRAFLTDESGRVVGYDEQKEEIVQWIP